MSIAENEVMLFEHLLPISYTLESVSNEHRHSRETTKKNWHSFVVYNLYVSIRSWISTANMWLAHSHLGTCDERWEIIALLGVNRISRIHRATAAIMNKKQKSQMLVFASAKCQIAQSTREFNLKINFMIFNIILLNVVVRCPRLGLFGPPAALHECTLHTSCAFRQLTINVLAKKFSIGKKRGLNEFFHGINWISFQIEIM